MLSGNPNSTGDPSSTLLVISWKKNITNLLGIILILRTHAEKGLFVGKWNIILKPTKQDSLGLTVNIKNSVSLLCIIRNYWGLKCASSLSTKGNKCHSRTRQTAHYKTILFQTKLTKCARVHIFNLERKGASMIVKRRHSRYVVALVYPFSRHNVIPGYTRHAHHDVTLVYMRRDVTPVN